MFVLASALLVLGIWGGTAPLTRWSYPVLCKPKVRTSVGASQYRGLYILGETGDRDRALRALMRDARGANFPSRSSNYTIAVTEVSLGLESPVESRGLTVIREAKSPL